MKNTIEEVRKFVEEECKKPTSRYGCTPYLAHFIPMAGYARFLAEKLNADAEIVEIAAWLHDIGSIIHGREEHHITGAEIAEKKLREWGYPEEKIAKVKHCIISHRGSKNIKRETIEAQIIADADAMDIFNDVKNRIKAATDYENKTLEEAKKSVRQKLINSFNKLSSQAKEIAKPKFEAAVLQLNQIE
jgi:uncharacterized protein